MDSQSEIELLMRVKEEGPLLVAWDILGEALGPFVAEKTGKACFSQTRDVSKILGEMEYSWKDHFETLTPYAVDRRPRSWVIDLRKFRNIPFHQVDYGVHDTIKYLHQMVQLLNTIPAPEQANSIRWIYSYLANEVFNEAGPKHLSETGEVPQLLKQVTELQSQMAHLISQQGNARSVLATISPAYILAQSNVPGLDDLALQGDGALEVVGINLRIKNPLLFRDRGQEALRRGQGETAIANFTRAIELDSRLAAELNRPLAFAYWLKGNTYVDEENFDGAIDAISEALRLVPDLAGLYGNRALAYEGKGCYDLAIGDNNTALRMDPDCAPVYTGRGTCYSLIGEFDRAIADFSEFIRLMPGDRKGYYNRGNAFLSLRMYDEAIEDFDSTVELDEKYAVAFDCRGSAYFFKGDYHQAIADHSTAIDLGPGNSTYYYNRGTDYMAVGDPDSAIADYTVAIVLDSNSGMFYNNRGIAYAALGDHDQAISDYDACLNLGSGFIGAYFNRAKSFVTKGEYDRAIADFSIVVAESNSGEGQEMARNALEIAVRLRTQIAEYDRQIDENPDDPENWHLRGLFFLGIENLPRALQELKESLERGPDIAEVWNDLGWALWLQEELELAHRAYSRAIELKNDFAQAYYNRAWTWCRRKAPREAIADFTLAITHDPNYALAFEHRGICYIEIEEFEKAQDDIDEVERLGFKS